MVVMR